MNFSLCYDLNLSPTPLTSDPDQTDAGVGTKSTNLHHGNNRHGSSSGRLNKRPSFLSILTGSHWNTAICEGGCGYIHQHITYYTPSHKHTVSPPPASRVPPFKRYKSHSESHSPSLHSSHLQLRASKSVDSTRISLGHDEVDLPEAANNDDVIARSEEDIEAGRSTTVQLTVCLTGHMTHTLYHTTIQWLQVNVVLSKLPEFDESSFVQKKYNRLSWYLLTVIIFYGIPAFQLVLTYQQVCQ